MSPLKRTLQRLGSWTVGKASGLSVNDVTSGFRAFSREAAMQINVFNPFTYTLETIIQAGNRNLGVQSVPVRTNAPIRPSRLYRGIVTYLRKSVATIFRIYTIYSPLKTFFAIGSLLMFLGVALGGRFLWYFLQGDRGGHVQSLILAAVFLITGFQTWLIALLADLIAVNRRLSEDVLVRVKHLESPETARGRRRITAITEKPQPQQQQQQQQPPQAAQAPQQQPPRPPRREAPAPAAAAAAEEKQATQWVWLLDEDKLENRGAKPDTKPTAPRVDEEEDEDETLTTSAPGNSRRRRRRRGGARQHTELPGNRGKHLVGGGDDQGE
jgi:hypothetical protein